VEVYKITDLDQMSEALREYAFRNEDLGTPSAELGYDGYITVPQVKQMILERAVEADGGHYIADEDIALVVTAIAKRVVTTALARLASAGLVEVGFEDGEFTFWKAEGDENDIRAVA
jgi:hypothetical protein